MPLNHFDMTSKYQPNQIPKQSKKIEKTSQSEKLDISEIPSSFDRSIEPEYTSQPKLKVPKIWNHKFQNDIEIYGVKHDELPLINFGISIKGGMLLEDPKKVGVANLITDMMMQGTANKTPEQ